MQGNVVQQQVGEIATALYRRTDELAPVLARAITREVRLYQTTTPVPFDVIVGGCAANMRPIFSAIAADSAFDPTAAAELGIQRAGDGVPLTSLMEAYRVGFRCVWEAVMTETATHNHVNGEALRALTAKVSAAQDIYTDTMAAGYREEQARRVLSEESERFVLIDSVLCGRLLEQWSVWEAADYLRLPTEGPYVVIAAEIAEMGLRPCRKSNRSCAAWMCTRRGGCFRICKSGSCTSRLKNISRVCWRSCPAWRRRGSGSARASTTCARRHKRFDTPGLPCGAGRTRNGVSHSSTARYSPLPQSAPQR